MKDKLIKLVGSKKFTIVVTFVGLFLLSIGGSWGLFTFLKGEPEVDLSGDTTQKRQKIDQNLPKTQECPINGKMYTKPEEAIWNTRRPITAMIENHADSRPQSGLSFADVVYEAVAEGGITRFMSVFYCGVAAEEVKIAPVRSVRVYFINWATEYGKSPIFVHVGGANNICNTCPGGIKTYGQVGKEVNAFKVLDDLGWRYSKGNDFDGGTNIGYPVIVRDQYRLGDKSAWEHSVVGFTDKIFEEAEKRGFAAKDEDGVSWNDTFKSWKFIDDKGISSPMATAISFKFWENKEDYDVEWKYDSSSNSYLRFNGGEEHLDLETKSQIASKNVVIMFVKEKGPVDSEGHMFYTTIGEGKTITFQNGDVVKGTWKKSSQESRTMFYDDSGKEMGFVRGQVWIEAVPVGNVINY